MIHDNLRVTAAHDTVLDYAEFFLLLLEFDTRWDEFLLSMTKIPSDDILEESVHNEDTGVWATQDHIRIVRHGNSSKDIDAQLSEIKNDDEEEYRSATSITKLWG